MKEYDVIVAYEDPLKRLGIKAMLDAPKDMKFNLYEDVSDLEVLKKVIVQWQPDFIVIDATLNSDDSGIKLAEYTRLHSRRTRIVIMAFSLNDKLIKKLKNLEIRWVLYKADTVPNITKCAGRAIQNKPYISRIFREAWYEDKPALFPKSRNTHLNLLSKTEQKVFDQVASGKTNMEIAKSLFKSEKTIKNHRHNICKKLDLKGSNALFKFSVKLNNVHF